MKFCGKLITVSVLAVSSGYSVNAQDNQLSIMSYLDDPSADISWDVTSVSHEITHQINPAAKQKPVTIYRNVQSVSITPPDGSRLSRLRSLIASAEAGSRGYDAIQHGAKRLPRYNPTSMSIAEILDWVKATPNQPHAIGRYQFIPNTLRDLIRRGDISPNIQFTPDLQDRLANILLMDAGLLRFQQGRISQTEFMNNLARIWAGLPTSSGKSAYHGYAGNQATINWAAFSHEMASIFQ